MDVNLFDLIVGTIILLLGLKGILNGFFKELFGLIGIIGGIFVASRIGSSIGTLLNDLIFHFESESAVSFTGFLFTLALFWVSMIALGLVFKKLSKLSGLGPVDKIFGFILGSGKFFLIGAVIAFSIYNIKTVRTNLKPMMDSSILFPILVETGSIIMKLDPIDVVDDINTSVEDIKKNAQKSINKQVAIEVDKKAEEIIKKVDDAVLRNAQ